MVASTVPQSISLDPAASSSESAPDESDDAIVLGVLDAVERNSAMTQRLVARELGDRKSTRLNSSHIPLSRMPSSA